MGFNHAVHKKTGNVVLCDLSTVDLNEYEPIIEEMEGNFSAVNPFTQQNESVSMNSKAQESLRIQAEQRKAEALEKLSANPTVNQEKKKAGRPKKSA